MPVDFLELQRAAADAPAGEVLGRSREGREICGHRFGAGPTRVSLIAGCHADEPVGPDLLRRLVSVLARRPADAPALRDYSWWIVPHANPDGAARNAAWAEPLPAAVDPVAYLRHVVRELPGDDVEFGFPRDEEDDGARPENRALYDWWRAAGAPFHVHGSLHGTMWAFGAWWLLEPGWAKRTHPLQQRCAEAAAALGYGLHDIDRQGDKGFWRIGPGFTTRPDSREMATFFTERGEPEVAARFRPSSFETMRSLGGDPLTFVTELPLFIAVRELSHDRQERRHAYWRDRWQRRVRVAHEAGDHPEVAAMLRARIARDFRAMPVRDQQQLQWELVRGALEAVGTP